MNVTDKNLLDDEIRKSFGEGSPLRMYGTGVRNTGMNVTGMRGTGTVTPFGKMGSLGGAASLRHATPMRTQESFARR